MDSFPSPDFYHLLFRKGGAAQIILDPATGCVVDLSEGASLLVGQPGDELCGQPLGDLVVEPANLKHACEWPQGTYRLTCRVADGRVRNMEARATLANDNGRPIQHILLTDLDQGDGVGPFNPDPMVPSPKEVPPSFFQFLRSAKGEYSAPYVSDNYLEVFRLRPHPLTRDVNKTMSQHLRPEDMVHLIKALEESHLTLRPFDHEFRMHMLDGRERWVKTMAIPSRRADGGTLWSGVVVDITDQRMAQESLKASEASYRQLVENAADGLCVLDEEGVIAYANRRLAVMLGQELAGLQGKRLGRWLDPQDQAALKTAKSQAETAHTGKVTVALRPMDGAAPFAALLSLTPIQEEGGPVEGFLVSIMDMRLR